MKSDGLFSGPIPGQSLTRSPDQRGPHEMPPKFADSTAAMDHLLMMVMDKKFTRNYGYLVSKNKKLFVDKMASAILQQGFVHGMWSVDTAMLLIEPLICLLVWKAANMDATVSFSTDTGFEDRSGFDYVVGQMFQNSPDAEMITQPTAEDIQAEKQATASAAADNPDENPRNPVVTSPLLGGN